MKLHIKNFRGTAPNTDPRLLDTNFATEAKNCSIDTGAIAPFTNSKDEGETLSASTKTIYPYQGNRLSWTTSVDVCKTPIENDLWERIYYTGDGVPKFKAIKRHEVSTAYALNTQIKWTTGDTVWKCTTAGTTAATAPSITSVAIGATVSDGSAVWTRLNETTNYPDYDTIPLKIDRPSVAPAYSETAIAEYFVVIQPYFEDGDGTEHIVDPPNAMTEPPRKILIGLSEYETLTYAVWIPTTHTSFGKHSSWPAATAENRGNVISWNGGTPAEVTTIHIGGAFFGVTHIETPLDYWASIARPGGAEASSVLRLKMVIYRYGGGGLGNTSAMIAAGTVIGVLYEEESVHASDSYTAGVPIPPLFKKTTYATSAVLQSEVGISTTGISTTAKAKYEGGWDAANCANVVHYFDFSASSAEATTSVSYLTTYIDKYGRESRSSNPVSVDVLATMPYKLTFSDTTADTTIRYRRLYRVSSTSNAGGEYLFVADIPIATTTYYDNVTNMNLGDAVPSIEWYEPDDDLSGLVSLPGGFFAAFSGRSIKFCEPNHPWAWPAYDISVDDYVVGLGVSGNNIVVLTTGAPAIVTTSGPALTSVSYIASQQSCLSKDSIVMDAGVVYFASPDGYCMADGAVITNLTAPFLSKEQWNEYNPASITAFAYDGKVYLSPNTGDTVIYSYSTKEAGLITMDIRFHAAYYEATTDTLFYVSAGKVYSLFAGTGKMEATWGKRLYSDQPTVPKMIRVYSDAYPVTIRLSNTTATHEIKVNSADVFRLPKMRKDREWIATYTGRATVSEIALSSGMEGILR